MLTPASGHPVAVDFDGTLADSPVTPGALAVLACEVGVAVANAVGAVRDHADVVLAKPDGEGVAELLRGPLLTGRGYLHPSRWQLTLGTDERGEAVTVPASQLNIVICGGTGDGKSYLAGLPRPDIARLLSGPPRRAVLAWRRYPDGAVAFTLGPRATPHLRHEHKYGRCGVEPARRFHFRTEPDTATGAVAANLAELALCDEGVLRHHCPGRDFSRWVSDVFHDKALAVSLGAVESSLPAQSPGAVVDQVRLALIAELQERHPR